MRMEMPWECYHISKPISALKYTNVNAKLYSSMWWNYSSFYNNRCKLGTWSPWLQGKWEFGCRVRASCELAAGGAGTAGAHLTHGSCLQLKLCRGDQPELQPHCTAALPAPGHGPLVQTCQPYPVPWKGWCDGSLVGKVSLCSALGFPC